MSLGKNLTNRIFRIAIQAESAVIILINQQASAFGTDISGQFFVSPPKRFTGPIEAMRHPHFHDRANQEAAWQAVVNGRFNWTRTHRLLQRRWRDLGCLTEPVVPHRGRHADFYRRYVWWLQVCRRSFAQTAPGTPVSPACGVRGFSDHAGPDSHSRLTRLPYCLPPTHHGVGIRR